ncbi:MAG TPA: palindromic element RPE5 domain-containing protein [Rickettsia endosymbiont of Pyrocoelia pectoralis]|nr:palindromic element RPE5 domain-containing protein [Rickettsia endosymbiont of Pyrocoelia pectoralis]
MKYEILEKKKKQLDALRPLSSELAKNLEEWFKVELTYTSNAIEGNTLTRKETAIVVEKGLTIGGKTLVEHLEATNHAKALDVIYKLAKKKYYEITEKDILAIHYAILHGIDDHNAGHYRNVSVYSNKMKSSYTKINLENSKEFVSRGAERTIVREHPRTYKNDVANFSS